MPEYILYFPQCPQRLLSRAEGGRRAERVPGIVPAPPASVSPSAFVSSSAFLDNGTCIETEVDDELRLKYGSPFLSSTSSP